MKQQQQNITFHSCDPHTLTHTHHAQIEKLFLIRLQTKYLKTRKTKLKNNKMLYNIRLLLLLLLRLRLLL